MTLRHKLQKLENRGALVLTFSDYDEDAGYLIELLGWKNLARQHEIEKATMVYRCWLQNIRVLGLQYKKQHITLGSLRVNFASHYQGQIIIKIPLAIVAPFYGTNSHVM